MAANSTPIIYSDFRTDFAAHPVSGDLVLVVNEASVSQSIRNLLLTSNFERNDSSIGGNVKGTLFENPSVITEDTLRSNIRLAITNHEPRASVIDVYVSFLPDSNAYGVTVKFTVQNVNRPVTLNVLLQRVR